MKNLFCVLMLSSAFLISCIEKEAITDASSLCDEKELKFEFNISKDNEITRTTMPADGLSSSFVNGDEIGVYVYNSETELYDNVKYTYDGADWSSEYVITVATDVPVTCYAYYPYSDGFNLESQDITVGKTDLYDNDFLFDEVSAEAGQQNISFMFEHKMALLEFKLDKTGDPATEVVLKGVKNVLNLSSKNTFTTKEASTGDISMTCIDETNRIYRAFLPAQTITSDTQFLSATINGETKTLTAKNDLVLTAGERTTIDTNPVVSNPNLIVDGDFEAANIKAAWSIENASRETNNHINGTGSLKLGKRSNQYCGASLINSITVEEGKTYEFGYIGRIQDSDGPNSETNVNTKGRSITMSIKALDDTNLGSLSTNIPQNTEKSGEITIPGGVTAVKISIWTSWADATAYIDDVYFKLKE